MLQNDSTKSADVVRIWKDLINNVTNIIDDDQIITPYHMLMRRLENLYIYSNILIVDIIIICLIYC